MQKRLTKNVKIDKNLKNKFLLYKKQLNNIIKKIIYIMTEHKVLKNE